MSWGHEEDADAVAESGLATVGMDGMLLRCPLAVFGAFGMAVLPLRRGDIEGFIHLRQREVRIDMSGGIEDVRSRMAHEGGHLVLHLAGYRLPHNEAFASRCGRAIVIGERAMRRAIDTHPYSIIPHLYADWLPYRQVSMRLWEVQIRRMRRTG